jgi:hypothetical protein
LKERNKVFDILNLEKLIESLTRFVELKLQIYELKVKEQMVVVISRIAVLTIMLLFGLIIIFFFSMALAYYLNGLLDSGFMGFILVGSIYLTIGLVLMLFKSRLITNHLFQAFFSDTILKGDYDDEQEERNED